MRSWPFLVLAAPSAAVGTAIAGFVMGHSLWRTLGISLVVAMTSYLYGKQLLKGWGLPANATTDDVNAARKKRNAQGP